MTMVYQGFQKVSRKENEGAKAQSSCGFSLRLCGIPSTLCVKK
jgi:hypothetical protein